MQRQRQVFLHHLSNRQRRRKSKINNSSKEKNKKKDEVQIKDEGDSIRAKLAHAYAEVGMNKAHFVFSLHV